MMLSLSLILAGFCGAAMALAEGEAPGAGDGGPGDGGSGGGAGGGGGQAPDPAQTQQESSGFRLTLTEEQKAKLLADGSLDLSDEQYTGGVRSQMETLRQRAKAAEKKLTDIAAAQQETERKTLEEQKKFQTLYETERTARETDRVARKEDLVKSRFLLAATKAGVINPDDAFVIARTLPGFGAVQVDDEGKVSGLEDLLTALVKDKPYLVAQPQKPTTVGGPSNPGQSGSERPAPKTVAEAGDALADWALRHA